MPSGRTLTSAAAWARAALSSCALEQPVATVTNRAEASSRVRMAWTLPNSPARGNATHEGRTARIAQSAHSGDSRRVFRVLLVVAVLTGCDQVWQLERDVLPPVCGPYSAPVEVVFSPTITNPHDFSVDSSGTRGLI